MNLASMFCSVPISTASQLQLTFTSAGNSPLDLATTGYYLNSFAITHNLCRQDLNCIQLSPRAQVWHPPMTFFSCDRRTHSEYTVTHKGAHKKRWAVAVYIIQCRPSSANFWALFGGLLNPWQSRNNHWPSQYPQTCPTSLRPVEFWR